MMSDMDFQKDRQYELKVGQGGGTGLLIENLHIDFTVTKSSNNKLKPNRANISIYNLSEDNQKFFEKPFVEVDLSVGYQGVGMHRLFAGQVTLASSRREGTDIVTEIQLNSLYTQLNNKRVSQTAPAGSSVRDVIEKVSAGLGVVSVSYSGENIKKALIDGYPMTGTPRQILTQLAEAFDLEWQVDGQILYIQDVGNSYMMDSSKAIVISETNGLIERPYYDTIEKRRGKGDKLRESRKGVKLKMLLNPSIIAGSTVKIDHGEFTGFYKVEQVTHRGGIFSEEWVSELTCGTVLK